MCNERTKCPLGRLIIRRTAELMSRDAWSEDMDDAMVLGLLLSEHFQWNGVAILEAAAVGLEDANYHRECETVLGLIRIAKQAFKQKN